MGVAEAEEIERKYDVDETTVLPTLAGLDCVTSMSQAVEVQLESVYFDTSELDLARRGVTLRRRTGGSDPGWHAKLPQGEDTRVELRRPLGRGIKAVPKELLAPVRALVRDRELGPVARVRTRRLEHALLGEDGAVLAHVCDDQVHAERLHGPAQHRDWREWEVELVDGDRDLLDVVEHRLLAAGAAPAAAGSKLLRTLGDAVPPPGVMSSGEELSRGTAARVLLSHLAAQVAELHEQDSRLRTDAPSAVHKLRIAARRLRSALRTYGPFFEQDSVDGVVEDLRWLGQSLSGARDAQVLRERLHLLVATEPPELVLGPVLKRLDDELRVAERAGRQQALEALDSERYFRLVDALDELLQSPPLTAKAGAPAPETLPTLLRRDAKRLRRAVRAIPHAAGSEDRDTALHEARKKAKRMRYAAESARPALGRRAKALATSAKKVQQALGEHQDAVMSRRRLREYGVRAHADGENGFSFGRLHGLEQGRAEAAVREFEKQWKRFPARKAKGLRDWG